MTFQNLCEIFKCTHEESLALWDYLMFLRVKDMLKQPPLPVITEEDMGWFDTRPLFAKEAAAAIAFKLTNAPPAEVVIGLSSRAAKKLYGAAHITSMTCTQCKSLFCFHILTVDRASVACWNCGTSNTVYRSSLPEKESE